MMAWDDHSCLSERIPVGQGETSCHELASGLKVSITHPHLPKNCLFLVIPNEGHSTYNFPALKLKLSSYCPFSFKWNQFPLAFCAGETASNQSPRCGEPIFFNFYANTPTVLDSPFSSLSKAQFSNQDRAQGLGSTQLNNYCTFPSSCPSHDVSINTSQ